MTMVRGCSISSIDSADVGSQAGAIGGMTLAVSGDAERRDDI